MNGSDGIDLSEIRYVRRVAVGSLDQNKPVSEDQRDAQIAILNRCLNDLPRGRIIGREISTAVYLEAEQRITLMITTYHVGFTRKPFWIEEEEEA